MDKRSFLGRILASYVKINHVFLSAQVESTLAPETAASQQHRGSEAAQTTGAIEDKVEVHLFFDSHFFHCELFYNCTF